MAYNKAVRAIADAKRTTLKALQSNVFNWVDTCRGTAGVISTGNNANVPLDDRGVVAVVGGTAQTGSPRVLTWAEAENAAKAIDNLNVGANHLLVKGDLKWQQIYRLGQRNVQYMQGNGTIVQKSEATMPCHNCGVVLPMEFLQVDHQMPQAAGSDLHVLKTLRALDMTTQAPSGGKGSAYVGNTLNGLVLNPKGRDRTYNHLVNATAAAKWTTNPKGTAFLSIIDAVGALDSLARMCMNSLLNLTPLCGECNRVKSDYIKPIA